MFWREERRLRVKRIRKGRERKRNVQVEAKRTVWVRRREKKRGRCEQERERKGWERRGDGEGDLGGKKLEMQHGGWESVAIITKRRRLNANTLLEGEKETEEGEFRANSMWVAKRCDNRVEEPIAARCLLIVSTSPLDSFEYINPSEVSLKKPSHPLLLPPLSGLFVNPSCFS